MLSKKKSVVITNLAPARPKSSTGGVSPPLPRDNTEADAEPSLTKSCIDPCAVPPDAFETMAEEHNVDTKEMPITLTDSVEKQYCRFAPEDLFVHLHPPSCGL